MQYDLRLLNKNEQKALKVLLNEFKNYDKVDILIEKIIDNKDEFKSRKIKNKKRKEIFVQKMDESLKFCDGDKCTISF